MAVLRHHTSWRPFTTLVAASLGAITLAVSCPAAATDGRSENSGTLRYDLAADIAVTGAGAVGWIAWEVAKVSVGPTTCRWCDRNADGSDSLNGFDSWARRTFRWSQPKTADVLSSLVGSAFMPIAAMGTDVLMASSEERLGDAPVDLLVIAEAVVIAANVNELTKFAFARERPDVHASTPAQRAASKSSEDDISFTSGHTTIAFAIATASGTVASLRGYRLAPVVWTAGLVLAAGTGYLRIAADRHYATDVLAGGAIGAAVGLALPYFAHRPHPQVAAAPIAGGAAITVLGSF